MIVLLLWGVLETPEAAMRRGTEDGFTYAQCSNMTSLKSLVGAVWPALLTVVGIWSGRLSSSSSPPQLRVMAGPRGGS